MKKLLSAVLSLLLVTTAAPAQKIATPTRDEEGVPRRETLRRRDPVPENAAPAPQVGGLESRLADLSQQISREMSDNQKRTIAVVEFVDLKGRVTDFGRFLAEELITRLYQTKKFKVIERQLLNKVVGEQKLSLTGIIDQTSAQKLGRLLGVEAIASGSVSDLGKSLRVNARLIDTGTAEVFAVASTEIAKDESVTRLMGGEADNPPTGAGGGGAASPPEQGGPQQRIESQFFTFILQQCRMSGTSIICDFRITNNDADRVFGLDSYESSVFDELGNGHRGAVAQLANQRDSIVEIGFITGVTTSARLTFDGVSPQATKITMLKVRFFIKGTGDYDIRFRNVPLVKVAAK